MKSAIRSESEWIPSATRPCDLAMLPTTTWITVSVRFTATLTQVLRRAAALRCSALYCGSSVSWARSVNFTSLARRYQQTILARLQARRGGVRCMSRTMSGISRVVRA